MKFLEPLDIKKILDSTDTFLFNIDGVLKLGSCPIPGAISCIQGLRRLGKQIGFVTNGSCFNLEDQRNRLSFFEPTNDEIFTPHNAIIDHLQKINFQKDLFVISGSPTKKILQDYGFTVIDLKDITKTPVEETLSAVIEITERTIHVCSNVGAVLIDLDIGFSHLSAHIACVILRHFKDVLLLNCMLDDTGPIGNGIMMAGPRYYVDAIERVSGKKSLTLGKPASLLMDALKPAYKITDPSRVMFFGDNVMADIVFGYNCGFQTCLVLTGHTSEENFKEWKYPDEYKPNYVADSLAVMAL